MCIGWLRNSSSSSSLVFCPRVGPSLQAQEPRLQFCWWQVFHRKLRTQGCSFTRDLIGAVASHCFLYPTLSLASEQTLKDLKRSQGQRIAMAKEAFNRKRSIFRGPLEKELSKRLVKCFVWSVVLYGAETWTLRQNEQKRSEAFEIWILRRMEH